VVITDFYDEKKSVVVVVVLIIITTRNVISKMTKDIDYKWTQIKEPGWLVSI
jgi:hypothetical protein